MTGTPMLNKETCRHPGLEFLWRPGGKIQLLLARQAQRWANVYLLSYFSPPVDGFTVPTGRDKLLIFVSHHPFLTK